MRARYAILSLALAISAAGSAMAANVSVTPSTANIGYMNVSELPANGGAFVFGSGWGFGDTRANFTGNVLKLEATPIGTGDSFWYQNGTGGPGAAGNKQMDANAYVQDDALAGQSVTFSMNVLQNTFVQGYTSVAFIKEFVPDFSSFTEVTAPLVPGVFSLNKVTAAGNHIQYGFETIGANVWPTDVESKGFVTLSQVPEPATLGVIAGAGLLMGRRRKA